VQWSPSPETAALEVEAMRRFGVMNQLHVLETAETSRQMHARLRRIAAGLDAQEG
jgi:5-methylthioadenosine/S-adenosylhomocysteine deaminase